MKPSAIAAILPDLISSHVPVFIHGKSGVGKSSVMAQIAAAMGRELRDTRMTQLDSIDVRGFPVPDMKARKMEWLPATFLPGPKDKPSILFLDEFNGAPPAVQSPCYQLILDRRIGDYVLPDNCSVVAAGNGLGDRGITHAMPAPLNNRFQHIDFDLDATDWQARAVLDGIHPLVRAHLSLSPGDLHVFDAAINPRAFPTPRSWYLANKHFVKGYRGPELLELLQGAIGEGAAAKFLGFVKAVEHMPDMNDVVANPKTAKLPGSVPVSHAVVTALVDRTKASNFDKLMDYVNRLERDLQMVFVRHAIAKDNNVVGCKEYARWGLANQRLLGIPA